MVPSRPQQEINLSLHNRWMKLSPSLINTILSLKRDKKPFNHHLQLVKMCARSVRCWFDANVCYKNKYTKRSSVLLLRLVRFSMTQTLFLLQKSYWLYSTYSTTMDILVCVSTLQSIEHFLPTFFNFSSFCKLPSFDCTQSREFWLLHLP